MTVLGALVRSVENPLLPLTSTALLEWLGGEKVDAGVSVTERRVYGLPAYYRGIAIKAGTLAGLPFKVYEHGTRKPVRSSTVFDNPNPRQTPFEFWQTTYANATAWGNGYGFKIRDGMDIVREVWPIHPSRVAPFEVTPSASNPAGKVFDVLFPDGTQARFTPRDIFHLPYLSLDGVSGIRPIELFRQSLGTAIAADQAAAKFFGNGSMISGILSTDQPLDEAKANALKRRWKAKLAGPQRAGEVAVLDSGTTFQAIAIPPGDAQLLESRKWSVGEIARMVGVLPHMIGDTERSTSWGTGIEQQVLGWVKFDLNGWIELTEQRGTRELLPGGWTQSKWFAEISLEGLLRGDSKARAEFYRVMTSIGAMKPTRVQELENEPVDPAVDFYMVPKNMAIVRDGKFVDPAPKTAKPAPAPNGGDTDVPTQ